MVSILQKASNYTLVKAAVYCGKRLFGRYLILTNVTLSTLSGGVGDIVQQHYDILSGQKKKWEKTHTNHMALAGITTGIVLHFWYILLDRWLPGKTLKVALKKVIVDQIIYSPINLVVFFGTVGILENSPKKYVYEEIIHKGFRIYLMEWYIWPPAQLLNFYVIPLKYRMLFDSLISFGFDIYMPYVKYKQEIRGAVSMKTDDGGNSKPSGSKLSTSACGIS